MSKVTIRDLVADYKNDGFEERYPHMIHTVEVVPRKMVEMIIARLEYNISACEEGGYAKYTLKNVKAYTESLLEQFEEDKDGVI